MQAAANTELCTSACKGETEHPGSLVLSTALSAGKTAMGEVGKIQLVGMSICFPLLRSDTLEVYSGTYTSADIYWITQ